MLTIVQEKDDFLSAPRSRCTSQLVPDAMESIEPFVYEHWRQAAHNVITDPSIQNKIDFMMTSTEEYTPCVSTVRLVERTQVNADHDNDLRGDLHNVGKLTREFRWLKTYEITTLRIRRPMKVFFYYNLLSELIRTKSNFNGMFNIFNVLECDTTITNIQMCPELAAQCFTSKTFVVDSTASKAHANISNVIGNNTSVNIPYMTNTRNGGNIYNDTIQYCFAARESYMWDNYGSGLVPFRTGALSESK